MEIAYNGTIYKIPNLEPDDLTFDEVERIEKVLGIPWFEILAAARNGSVLLTRPMIWQLLRRQLPDLRFDDIKDVRLSDVVADPQMPESQSDDSGANISEPSQQSSESDPGNGAS